MASIRVRLTHKNHNDKESPFFMDATVINMRKKWEIIHAVVNGTEYLHENAAVYLPREPREIKRRVNGVGMYDPWVKRVNLSVLAPFTKRIIHNAAGMVLRRKIKLEGGDPYWKEVFAKDVDGDGTSLDQFALGRFETSLTYGMSTIVVSAQKRKAVTARDELEPLRPYFVPVDPWQYLGHRRKDDNPGAKLTMFRYQEERRTDDGEYGEEYVAAARVIIPGAYELFEADKKVAVDIGLFDLDYIPVVDIYSQKTGYRCATPPLADVAHLNIAHYRRLADLLHSLHVAAIGLLVLENYDGEEDAASGANYAINMSTGSKAYWVQYDAGSLVAQAELLDRLENEISHLGVTQLLGQKHVAESAEAKRIDQQQANCVLAVTAQELENSLNEAFRMASDYNGMAPPKVIIDKDFDFYRLLGQDVSVLAELEQNGQITTEAFLKILARGEWLPQDMDISDLLEKVKVLKEAAERKMMAQQRQQQALKPAAPK
jgi:hypothetical protein